MRKFHSIAALCGDGLRPELKALFDRLAVNPDSELFRDDGMIGRSGPRFRGGSQQCRYLKEKNGPSLNGEGLFFHSACSLSAATCGNCHSRISLRSGGLRLLTYCSSFRGALLREPGIHNHD
jgi:hypothetical protein